MRHSQGSVSSGNRNKRVFAAHENEVMPQGYAISGLKSGGIVGRAKFLSNKCRQIMQSDDPICCIKQCVLSDFRMIISDPKSKLNCRTRVVPFDKGKFPVGDELMVNGAGQDIHIAQEVQPCENSRVGQDMHVNKDKCETKCFCCGSDSLFLKGTSGIYSEGGSERYSSLNSVGKVNSPDPSDVQTNCQPPGTGKKFYLNRLHFMDHGSFSHQNVISLPELLHPIKSITRIFIATFTSDILW